MKLPSFHGPRRPQMSDFVTFKRTEGFDYTSQARSLHYFDAFLYGQWHEQTELNRETVEAYVAHTAQLAPNTRYDRLSIVRVFSRYLHQLDPASYVLHELPVKRPALPRWPPGAIRWWERRPRLPFPCRKLPQRRDLRRQSTVGFCNPA